MMLLHGAATRYTLCLALDRTGLELALFHPIQCANEG